MQQKAGHVARDSLLRDKASVRVLVHGLFATVAVITMAPTLLPFMGLLPLIVHGESMAPSLHRGDVILTRSVPAASVSIGEIVTFPDSRDESVLITHRVVERTRTGSSILFVTRGDANASTERWAIGIDEPLRRVSVRVPSFGHVAEFLSATPVKAAVVVPLAAWLWRPGGARRVK